MPTMKFVRDENATGKRPKIIKFDCSPRKAICAEYGYNMDNFFLENERTQFGMRVWDVKAGPKDSAPFHIGVLYHNPPQWSGGPSKPFPV